MRKEKQKCQILKLSHNNHCEKRETEVPNIKTVTLISPTDYKEPHAHFSLKTFIGNRKLNKTELKRIIASESEKPSNLLRVCL